MRLRENEIVTKFWHAFDIQNWEAASRLLDDGFTSHWVVTDEYFDKTGYIKVNADYPGKWHTKIVKYEETDKGCVCVIHVYSVASIMEFYVISFFAFKKGKIVGTTEYWSTVEKAPEWRKEYWMREKI